jgi:hypothetical protein
MSGYEKRVFAVRAKGFLEVNQVLKTVSARLSGDESWRTWAWRTSASSGEVGLVCAFCIE